MDFMRAHDSIRIGGPVRALAVPGDVFSLTKVCYLLHKNRVSPFILGNGTNIVIPDEGLNIFVMQPVTKSCLSHRLKKLVNLNIHDFEKEDVPWIPSPDLSSAPPTRKR